jgi:SAM-dependent methyltransferase
MTRNEKILAHIQKSGHGIEIGPSHAPIAPKKDGYRVDIIDHMSREQLLIKYADHGVNLANIEEVDHVWTGQTYAALTQKPKHYDWIIASHVIEHSPDLIDFLNNCEAVLKDGGVLSLVVPDKRYCFDHFRPITGLAKIIDSHLSKDTFHSAGTVAEYFLNVVSKAGDIGWHAHTGGDFKLVHTLQDAINGMQQVQTQQSYIDAHAWCFVPHSFRLLIRDLHALGLIGFQEIDFQPTDGYEFYITLGKSPKPLQSASETTPQLSRLDMLAQIEIEVQDLPPPPPVPMPLPAPPAKVSFARRVYRRLKRSLK